MLKSNIRKNAVYTKVSHLAWDVAQARTLTKTELKLVVDVTNS